jgi:PKD repeat protein
MKKQVLLILSVFFLFAGMGCYKKEAVPVADFIYASSNDSIVPDTLTFQNKSVNAYYYKWDFGDDQTSSDVNPVHIYTKGGNYTISLKAYTSSQKEWAVKNGSVVIK